MKHELPALPFAKDALEPLMSAETIEYHYGKHHKGYVDKLNKLIQGTEFEQLSLEEIICKASPGPIFNNAAQVWNHNFFWNCLNPKKPSLRGELKSAIERKFGSTDEFQKTFTQAAVDTFGSGWAWLVKNREGGVEIETMQNAGNPLKMGHGKTALLTMDVWEHAYYIDFRNDRGMFLKSAWNLINWTFVERNFSEGKAVAA